MDVGCGIVWPNLGMRFQFGKRLFNGGPDIADLHVAVNRQHAIVRHGQLLVERSQIAGGNLPDGFLRAERIQPVAGVAEQSAPHRDARALEQIILPGGNARNLHLAFAVQFVGGKRRVQQDIGEQIQPGREIAAQHLRVHAKAVVAAVAVNAAADGFNLRGDLLRAARRRALEQRLGEQLRDAVVRGRFRQHAALERRAKFHERQPVILLHQQAQAVRQFKLLDRLVAVRFNRRGNLRRRAVRQQRVKRAVFRREIFAGDALDIAACVTRLTAAR